VNNRTVVGKLSKAVKGPGSEGWSASTVMLGFSNANSLPAGIFSIAAYTVDSHL
jgi:hypothetical protein